MPQFDFVVKRSNFHKILTDIYHFMSRQQIQRDDNENSRGLPAGGVDLDVGVEPEGGRNDRRCC